MKLIIVGASILLFALSAAAQPQFEVAQVRQAKPAPGRV